MVKQYKHRHLLLGVKSLHLQNSINVLTDRGDIAYYNYDLDCWIAEPSSAEIDPPIAWCEIPKFEEESMKLYNKDCMEMFKEIEGTSVDLFISDVPYKTTPKGNAGNCGGMLQKKINMQGRVFDNNSIEPSDYLPEIYRVLKDGSHCYIMTNHTNLQKILNVATEIGFHFIKSLVWVKDNKIMGQYYMSQFEYILFFRKGKGIKINNCGTSDVLPFANKKTKGADGKNLHDTEKPVDLMKVLVSNSSKEGDIVMDCFMGTGTTGVAAVSKGRNFIGVEIVEKYFKTCQQRINSQDLF